jgi:arylsulfatase A-like enzyme
MRRRSGCGVHAVVLRLCGATIIAATTSTTVATTATPVGGKPNFIFLLADDWGWGDNAFNTGPKKDPWAPSHTPHLEALAASGVVFSDFHTASPVCSPSRAGFMTGRDPSRFRIHTALNHNWTTNAAQDQADFLDPATVTVTSLLQRAGWRTGHFGKWHLGSGANVTGGNVSAPVPTDYGIDESCTFNSNDACAADAHSSNTSVDIMGRGMAFISEAAAAGDPFYVNIWLHVSHERLDPTAAQKAAALPLACPKAPSELATNQTMCAQAVFVAAQTDADTQVGRLVALLGHLNLRESTLLLFSTDNGPEEQQVYSNAQGSTGPFRGRKRSLYEGGTRVPSFAVWGGGTPKPQIPRGAVEHTLMSAVDWLPTVAAIAGVALPTGLRKQLDGIDMSRVLLRNATGQRLPAASRAKPLFWEWRYAIAGVCDNVSPHLAVRDGEWKYLANADGSRGELYKLDLYNGNATYTPDFNERANLANAFPEKAAQLAAKLRAWHATIPPCAAYQTSASCAQFSSNVFPGKGAAMPAEHLEAEAPQQPTWEDMEPDFYWNDTAGHHVSY